MILIANYEQISERENEIFKVSAEILHIDLVK